MSEKDAKKTAARDISDLKARLGLKKGGADPAAARQSGSHGVVPPPGIAPPGARSSGPHHVPPPPGIAPPPGAAPPAPQIPDARVDPFAAMNAIAAHGAATQAAPPIVIVDDGRPVESVQGKSKLGLVKWAGVGIGALVIGYLVGGISYKNQEYNNTIRDAAVLTEEIRTAGRTLQELQNELLLGKERGQGNTFVPNDRKLTEALENLKLGTRKPDRQRLLYSHLYFLDPQLIEDTLLFYADVFTLYDLVERHVRLSKSDERAPKENPVLQKLGGNPLGVVFRAPQGGGGGPVMGELVQLGRPICQDRQPRAEGCGADPPFGFEFRPDPVQPAWGSRPLPFDAMSVDNVVILANTPVIRIFFQGVKEFYDEHAYRQRIEDIDARTTSLIERRTSIENRLNSKAQESKRFSL